jgi:hypothetical protein
VIRTRKPLVLRRQTVHVLEAPLLGRAIGGIPLPGDPSGNASSDITGVQTAGVKCTDTVGQSKSVCQYTCYYPCGVPR